MAKVDKSLADKLIAGNGWMDAHDHDAPDNPQCVRITKFTNAWGGDAYGVVFATDRDLDKYSRPTEYVQNPVTYWEAP